MGSGSDSQSQQSKHPDAQLGCQKVPGTGPPVRVGAGLREELAVSGHQVTVAVDHLPAVVDCPAQAAALQRWSYSLQEESPQRWTKYFTSFPSPLLYFWPNRKRWKIHFCHKLITNTLFYIGISQNFLFSTNPTSNKSLRKVSFLIPFFLNCHD